MLELKNISFTVPDDENGRRLGIIKDISFKLDNGRLLVITGPNGGGKSTLARLIMGIEKPTGGRIIYDGNDITALSVTERAKLGIGYAFQQPPRFKGLTVGKLLSLASGSELPADECCSFLTGVGLCSKDYLQRPADASLSGGEMKRIEIASLMARNPGLAIFDEPEAGIDLWSFSMLVQRFSEMAQARERSVIIISHQEKIMELADEIMVVADGVICARGGREQLLPSLFGGPGCSCEMKRAWKGGSPNA